MRLNKMRLAAAMMSAVMAASTIPMTAFADELIVDEGVVVEEQVEAAAATVTGVTIDKDGNVTVTYSDQTTGKWDTKADVKVQDATCTTAKTYVATITIDGKTWTEKITEGNALGHLWGTKQELAVDTYPTCSTEGTGHYYVTCQRTGCTETNTVEENVPIAKTSHTSGEPEVIYTADKDGNVIISEDGKTLVGLDDPSQDGTYTKTTTVRCKVCNAVIDQDVEKDLTYKATGMAVAVKKAVTDDGSNIDNSKTQVNGLLLSSVPEDEEIALSKCTEDGYYWIVSYSDADGKKEISRVKHTVSAHHLTTITYEAKETANDKLLDPVYDEDHKLIGVKNLSCVKPVEYYEVETCTVEGKVLSRTLKTAEPAGVHIVDKDGKDAVDAAKEEAKNKGLISKNTYAGLKNNEKGYGISVVAKDTCKAEGTVTITSYCTVCGKPADTVTLKVEKLGHVWGANVEENKVEATCAKAGSYDVARYCEVCNEKEEVRTGVIIPALDHTYAKDGSGIGVEFVGNVVVDYYDGCIEKDDPYNLYQPVGMTGYSVTAKLYDKCTVCGKKVYSDDVNYGIANNSFANAVKVVDVKKQDGNGNPGSITLSATYKATTKEGKAKTVTVEGTFDYYSDLVAYIDRNPGKAINGLHEDSDGTWRYYKDGILQDDFSGIVEYNGAEFFVANGVKCADANGLNMYDGTWYMLSGGQIARGYTDLALYNGEWFYLVDGELDVTNNGLVEYNGAKFALAAGRLLSNVTGLWQNPQDGEWYYLAEGRVVNYTGTTTYNGATFKLVDGKIVG